MSSIGTVTATLAAKTKAGAALWEMIPVELRKKIAIAIWDKTLKKLDEWKKNRGDLKKRAIAEGALEKMSKDLWADNEEQLDLDELEHNLEELEKEGIDKAKARSMHSRINIHKRHRANTRTESGALSHRLVMKKGTKAKKKSKPIKEKSTSTKMASTPIKKKIAINEKTASTRRKPASTRRKPASTRRKPASTRRKPSRRSSRKGGKK